MVVEEVKKLLKKTKPAAKDLGRLYFFMNIFSKNANKHDDTFQYIEAIHLYLDKHLPNLSNEQAEIYVDYLSLYNIVRVYNHLGQGFYQQVLRCFYRIMLIVDNFVGNSTFLSEIQSMKDEFDIENVAADVMVLFQSLKRACAVDQFFEDIESRFDLYGLKESFGVFDTLEQCIQCYNDVVKCLEEKRTCEAILLWMPPIREKDYIPSEEKIKRARKQIRSIGSFRDKNMSTEFYNAYISE